MYSAVLFLFQKPSTFHCHINAYSDYYLLADQCGLLCRVGYVCSLNKWCRGCGMLCIINCWVHLMRSLPQSQKIYRYWIATPRVSMHLKNSSLKKADLSNKHIIHFLCLLTTCLSCSPNTMSIVSCSFHQNNKSSAVILHHNSIPLGSRVMSWGTYKSIG